MDLTQGSAILCQKPRFQDFLSIMVGYPVTNADEAARVVREHCGVFSRREFNTNTQAGMLYKQLIESFNVWANRAV